MKTIVTLLLLLGFTYAKANPLCKEHLGRLFSAPAKESVVVDFAPFQKLIGKPLDAQKMEAIKKAQQITPREVYTATDIAEQTHILKKGGFSDFEIAEMRKQSLIKNTTLKVSETLPEAIGALSDSFMKLGSKEIKDLRKGESFYYLIADDGSIYLSKKELNFSKNHILLGQNKIGNDVAEGFLVREGGKLSFDSKGSQFVFAPEYGLGSSAEELQSLTAQVKKLSHNTEKILHIDNPKIPKTKAIDCLDIVSAQMKGKNFILDRILGDNAVAAFGIVASELGGAGRLSSSAGAEVVAADLIGTNLGILINGSLGKKLVLNNANFKTAMATRAVVGTGMIEVQKNIHEMVMSNNAEERSQKIANFNQAHFAARMVINQQIDKFMIQQLPGMLYGSCLKNSKMKVLVNPSMVRLTERGASSLIYYGLRSSIINE